MGSIQGWFSHLRNRPAVSGIRPKGSFIMYPGVKLSIRKLTSRR